MAEGRTFQAKIELMGKLHASLSGAVKMAQAQLNRLSMTARKIGATMSRGFAKVGASIKSFAGQIVGLTLAYAGLRSAAEFIGKSKEQFRANEQAAAELNSTIANNPKILKLGQKELENQQKAFDALADRMQESGVYASSTWRAAFTGLAQWGAGAKDAEKLSGFINDILAGRHGLKATASDAKGLGDALGKVVATGKLGKFAREFGLTKDDEKRLGKMKTAVERINYIQQRAMKYRGRAEALGATEAGKIQQAENRIADFQSRMGKGFVRIEGQWIQFVDRLLPRLGPAIEGMTEQFEKGFGSFTNWVENKALPAWDSFGAAFKTPVVVDALYELQNAMEDFGYVVEPMVQAVKDLLGIKLGEEVPFKDWIKESVRKDIETTTAVLNKIADVLARIQGAWGQVQGFWDRITGKKIEAPEVAAAPAMAAATVTAPAAPSGAVAKVWEEIPAVGLAPPEADWAQFDTTVNQVVGTMTSMKGPDLDLTPVEAQAQAVDAAAKAAGAAFGGWQVPAALRSGLDAIISKVKEVTATMSAAAAGGAGPAPVAMQHGGIVTGPTQATIGEAGPEAVVPLGGGLGPLGAALNLGKAMQALSGSRHNINYTPNITVHGAGPEVVKQIERVVRGGVDELLGQIEALDSELMRRAFK